MTSRLPSAKQVLELTTEAVTVVPREFEDLNGHMNVRHYYELQTGAVGGLFGRIGYVPAAGQRRVGPFTVEQHLRYHAEVLVGHEVSTHLRLLDRNDKLLHGVGFLVNRTAGQVANTMEFLLGNVDLGCRKLTPFDVDTGAALDKEIERSRMLDWEPPLPERMGLRRS